MARWSFEEGMLFGAAGQWWNDKRRRTPHEGLDFRDYFYHHCKNVPNAISKGSVRAGDEVYPLLPGEVVAVFKDFMASTVVVAHRAAAAIGRDGGHGSVADGSSSSSSYGGDGGGGGVLCDGRADGGARRVVALEHGPSWLRCAGWPAPDRQLLTIFAHIAPAAGVAPGLVLDSPGKQPLGSIADGRSATAAPCHLHLSVALGRAAGDFDPPRSWGDLTSRFEFIDPPIPAGVIPPC